MTTPHDRDAAVERLLKSRRTDPPAAPGGVCLDAGLVAAWTDRTLSHDERAAVERHAADCARCQALLAAMLRTEPAAPVPASRRPSWAIVRWALPLSAAAAVALWFSVERTVPPAPLTQEKMQTAASPAPQAPPTDAAASRSARVDAPRPEPPRAEAPAASSRREAGSGRRDAPADVRGRRAPADRLAREEARVQPPAAPLQDRVTPSRARSATPPPAPPAASAPQSAAAPQPPSAAPSAGPEAASPPPAAAEPVAVAPFTGTAVQTQTAEAATAKRVSGVRATESVQRRTSPLWTEVPSPDALVRWRFSPQGDVEHSRDGGLSWTPQPVGSRRMLVAGAAPSSSVCWIAGRGGVVLRFTTERGWQRFSLPYSSDAVAIDAKDAENATVVLASGRRLTTTDGGARWR